MKYVEAPESYRSFPDDGPSIFLAGGITGCADWQQRACTLLRDTSLVVFNPRRACYDPSHGDSYEQQVDWEQRHLQLADVVLFWFPDSDALVTVQPIALLELGYVMAQAPYGDKRFVVGVDDGYPRRCDVQLQLRGRFPGTCVYRHLDDAVAAASAMALERRGSP